SMSDASATSSATHTPAAASAVQPAAGSSLIPAAPASPVAGVVSNLTAGTLSALVTLSYSISYGVLIFSAPGIEGQLGAGLRAALISAWVVALIVALRSSFFFSIAGPDSNATAILAVMSAAIAARINAGVHVPGQAAATVLVMLWSTAIIVGAIVFLVGALKRGRMIRFLPYPVTGGFLAGTGFLVVSGGLKVLTGKPLTFTTLFLIGDVPFLGLSVAFLLAAALLIIPRRIKHFLVMPGLIVLASAAFYIGLLVSGLSLDEARKAGLLFPPVQPFEAHAEQVSLWTLVRWDVLLTQWQDLLAMTIVVLVTILLNATGLDLATRSDVDFDRELRVNGIANMAAGLLGGMIGYISISRSLLNFKAGAISRFAGVWTALLCVGATYAFTEYTSFIPRPVLAGILLFLGIGMLREWIVESFSKLPLIEYELLVTIFLLIMILGLMPGVAFGLLVASVSFAYTYSKASCIKHRFSCDKNFSNKERSLEHIQQLRRDGMCGRTLALQGYIFFGTSSNIVEEVRALIEKEKVRFLLLDFHRVQGIDASAVLSFTKLEQVCQNARVKLFFSGLKKEVEDVFEQTKFLPNRRIKIFADMDHALEFIEDSILGVVGGMTLDVALQNSDPTDPDAEVPFFGTAQVAEMDLRRILAAHFKPETLDVVINFSQTLKLKEGDILIFQGDAADALYFVERGELSVMLNLPGGQTKRLRSFGPGTIVGEMGLYSGQKRSADVVAKATSRVRKFSAEALARMEKEHPDAAVQFHTFVAKLLCTRLAAANEEIRTLM
ncbi:MAG TPA: SulP family inorganic anion transporter, partial [Planctomycetota bacterium]|nr:SulP family inorganic anion transporter [Planctomycetota bacterium]